MKQGGAPAVSGDGRPSWIRKLEWLNKALWGGGFLLTIEHIWHGEITFWPPFLTAMSNPADFEEMLHEMATVGVLMALFITAVWFSAAFVVDRLQKLEVCSNGFHRCM
jgi:hypothetical protein